MIKWRIMQGLGFKIFNQPKERLLELKLDT